MAYTSWSVVFGEQPSAAKWNILGSNDSSFNDGTGIGTAAIFPVHLISGGSSSTWAWASWTPTLTNVTEGNGTKNAKYIQIGKTVFYKLDFTLGSTSSVGGAVTTSLPVTSTAITGSGEKYIGCAQYFDTSAAARYLGSVRHTSTTVGTLQSWRSDGTFLSLAAVDTTNPFTWANGDAIQIQGFYEAA